MNNNFINSLIQNNSTVSKYLNLSEDYLSSLKLDANINTLKDIRSIFSDITELEKTANEKILAIYSHKEKLFSNLITVMLANFYSIKILNGINQYKEYLKNNTKLNFGINNLTTILDDLSSSLSIFTDSLPNLDYSESSLNNPTASFILTDSLADKFIEKLDDLIKIFDEIKEPLGFSNLECTENGVENIDNIYNIDNSDLCSGTIKFFKRNKGSTEEDKLSDTEDIFSGVIDNDGYIEFTKKDSTKKQYLYATITTKTKKEYFLEDGTEEHPFIIKNENDAKRKGLFSNETDLSKHYILDDNLIINFSPTGDGSVHLRKTIIPNNHAIYLGPLIKRVFLNGKIKDNTLDIVMTSTLIARYIWYIHPVYPLPALSTKTVEFR